MERTYVHHFGPNHIFTVSTNMQGLKAQYHKEMYILSVSLRGPIKP